MKCQKLFITAAAVSLCSSLAIAEGDASHKSAGYESQSMGARSQESAVSSSVIREAQQQLNDQGYNAGPVDGIIGPRTQSALKKFQEKEGMQASGQLDEQTLSALGVQPSMGARSGEPESLPGTGASTGASEEPSSLPESAEAPEPSAPAEPSSSESSER